MSDRAQVLVFSKDHVPDNDQGCHGGSCGNLLEQTPVNSRIRESKEIPSKSIRGSVLHPIFMSVNRSTELATFLTVTLSTGDRLRLILGRTRERGL
jgi:hypothetical protein